MDVFCDDIAPGVYDLHIKTGLRSETASDKKLEFLFDIKRVKVNLWQASIPFGAQPFALQCTSAKTKKALLASVVSEIEHTIQPPDMTAFMADRRGQDSINDWQFTVNSGGFFTVVTHWRGYFVYASQNPRDVDHPWWDIQAQRRGRPKLCEQGPTFEAALKKVNDLIDAWSGLPIREVLA